MTANIDTPHRDFEFLDPGKLVDAELELVLVKKHPADPIKAWVPAYEFEMRHGVTGEKMGEISLRIGNNENSHYGGHLGYGVLEEFRGRRLASRSMQLLFELAKRHGLTQVWVTCNPENTASRKTCENAGGELIEIVDLPETNDQYLRGERKKCRYRFTL